MLNILNWLEKRGLFKNDIADDINTKITNYFLSFYAVPVVSWHRFKIFDTKKRERTPK